MARHIISAKYIFDGENMLTGHVIIKDEKNIIDIIPREDCDSLAIIQDLGDGVLTPGFIDLQVNGCNGVLFNDAITWDTLEIIYQYWLKCGTVGFLPTLITCDFELVLKALEVIKLWCSKFGNTRGVLGIHLEGPFISKLKKGIHVEHKIVPPRDEYLQQIVQYAEYFPIKMTIAVEEFTESQISFLATNGVILSIGHSNASYEQVLKSIKLGIVNITHVFNAMSGLSARKPGVIGAALATDLYVSVIVDLLHVHLANIKILTQLKPDKAYLVSDAVTPTGTAIKQFNLMGQELYVVNGKCIDSEGRLGGTCLTMLDAVRNCIKECEIPIIQVLKMASLIPAQLMKLDNLFGRIKPGYCTDLTFLDLEHFTCQVV